MKQSTAKLGCLSAAGALFLLFVLILMTAIGIASLFLIGFGAISFCGLNMINNFRAARAGRQLICLDAERSAYLKLKAGFYGGFFVAYAIAITLFLTLDAPNAPWLVPFFAFLPFVVWVCLMIRYSMQVHLSAPSDEQVAVFSQGTAVAGQSIDEWQTETEPNDAWPTIPKGTALEAGHQLAYRLNTSENAGCSLVLATFVNGIIGSFLFIAIRGFFNGNGNWLWNAVITPVCICLFVTVGLRLIVEFVTLLMAGTVWFEISHHPLIVGTSCQYLVEQSGLFPVRDMQLKLKCTESATRQSGRHSHTETREVFQQTVEDAQDLEGGGLHGNLCVPDDAMHSFDTPHHKITWELYVSGRVAGCLPYRNAFPVVVHPAGHFET